MPTPSEISRRVLPLVRVSAPRATRHGRSFARLARGPAWHTRCSLSCVLERRPLRLAQELMSAFEGRDARYLWTDAFAVCNFVGLGRALRDERWLRRAEDLVGRV